MWYIQIVKMWYIWILPGWSGNQMYGACCSAQNNNIKFNLDHQSWQQALSAYCLNIYFDNTSALWVPIDINRRAFTTKWYKAEWARPVVSCLIFRVFDYWTFFGVNTVLMGNQLLFIKKHQVLKHLFFVMSARKKSIHISKYWFPILD